MYLLLVCHGVVKAKKIKRSNKFLCQTLDGKFVLANSRLLTLLPDSSIIEDLKLISNITTKGMVPELNDDIKITASMYTNDPFFWAKAISIQRSNLTIRYHGRSFWWPDDVRLEKMEKQLNNFFEISEKLSKISHNNFIPKWAKDIKPYKTNMLLTKIELDLAS